MVFKQTYEQISLEMLPEFIKAILKNYPGKKLFCLYGNLGAGKTTISREIIKQLTGIATVTSPTFTIVQTYEGLGNYIYHYDLYRLKNSSELYEIGLLDNLIHGYSIIEWPELAADYLNQKEKLEIHISIENENNRKILLH